MHSNHCYITPLRAKQVLANYIKIKKTRNNKNEWCRVLASKKNQAARDGSSTPKAVVLTCVINGALTRWQVFERITALT